MPALLKVAIGVHLHTGPERAWATLASLRHEYRTGMELLLLLDRPDEKLLASLDRFRGVPRFLAAEPLDTPACFHRLAAASDADVLVLLEGGCEVGPHWLDHLLRALSADPRNGLAGPSTNLCGNEQEIFRGRHGGRLAVAQAAALAERRFGPEIQALEPPGGLADFCLAVRRDAVVAIGAAGFRSVWAKAAYVYRPPLPARRPPARSVLRPGPPPAAASPSQPLISCILPTRNRLDFVLQSIAYFERQDYPARELIVVDDGDDDLASRLPEGSPIRYLRLKGRHSIGAKRNLACQEARGEIIAQWDDDDWFAPHRLSAQAAPLLNGWGDISALVTDLFFELPAWTFWECTPAWHRRMFYEDVHGGTLVFRREVLRKARYPDQSIGEDAVFLYHAIRHRHQLVRITEPGLFLYLRHGANAWSFRCGSHLGRKGWRQVPEPAWSAEDREFYSRMSAWSRK